MDTTLRVLIVDDAESDTLLMLRELRRGGYEVVFRRVDNTSDVASALDDLLWDVILSDYSMPGFGPLALLDLLRDKNLDIPLIVISGVVGEELAVDVMRAGARDFVLKSNLKRLIPAIQREVQDAEERTPVGLDDKAGLARHLRRLVAPAVAQPGELLVPPPVLQAPQEGLVAVGMLDEEHLPARPHDPPHLLQRPHRVRKGACREGADHRIERAVRNRQAFRLHQGETHPAEHGGRLPAGLFGQRGAEEMGLK